MTTRARDTSTGATGWELADAFLSSSRPVSTLVIAVGQEVTKDTREERWFNTAFCVESRSIVTVEELDLPNTDLHLMNLFHCNI